MTFRHVAASEGDAVHVGIETVTPNSPAALADLQKGDRLIAIGGQNFKESSRLSIELEFILLFFCLFISNYELFFLLDLSLNSCIDISGWNDLCTECINLGPSVSF